MGYAHIQYEDGTSEILGDEQEYRRDHALPYFKPDGVFVSQEMLDEIDNCTGEDKP